MADIQASSTTATGLVEYIRDELFASWKRERQQGLEKKWQRNLDAFNCIDTGTWKKSEAKEPDDSTTFHMITRIKVLAAYVLVVDLMLQGGKVPFSLLPSPWDEMQAEDLPEEMQRRLRDSIEDMEALIHQQFADCKADRQLMKCVLSMALYGETYTKRFVHDVLRSGYQTISLAPPGLEDPEQQYTRFMPWEKTVISPGFEYKSVWNIFRDLESDDLQNSAGIIEREMVSAYWLRNRADMPFYDKEAIERVIAAAKKPGDQTLGLDQGTFPPGLRGLTSRRNTITYLEFWGRAPLQLVEEHEQRLHKSGFQPVSTHYEHDGKEVEIHCCLADDEVVRFKRNKPQSRPYDRAVWEIKLDHVEGTSVADNLEQVQKVLNGMIRAFEQSKKLASTIIAAIKEDWFAPGAWDQVLKNGGKIPVSEAVDDVRKAFQQVIIQDVGESCVTGIGLFERWGDEHSHLPKVLEGSTYAKQKPDTAYELSQHLASSTRYFGSVLRNIDEGLIEPNVEANYRFNMEDPDVSAGKGNYIPKANGFQTYQNKVLKKQSLRLFLALLLSDDELRAEGKTRKLIEELARAEDLDPDEVLRSPEEKEKVLKDRAAAAAQQQQMIAQFEKLKADVQAMLENLKSELRMREEAQKHEHELETKVVEHTLETEGKDQDLENEVAGQLATAGLKEKHDAGEASKTAS